MQHSRNVLKMNLCAAMATAYLNADSVMEHRIVLSMRREGVKTKRFEFQLLALNSPPSELSVLLSFASFSLLSVSNHEKWLFLPQNPSKHAW